MMRLPGAFARLGFVVLAGSSMLGAVGCAGSQKPPVRTTAQTFLFTIPYGKDDCPQRPVAFKLQAGKALSLDGDDKCSPSEADCAVVQNSLDTVEFKATGDGAKDREFLVQFAPFKDVGLPSKGGGTTTAVPLMNFFDKDAPTDPNAPHRHKVFNFFIYDLKKKDACPVIDPRIIVQN